MKRLAAWALLLLAALLVFSGIVDLAVGPELEMDETGTAGPRWYGAVYIVIGLVLAALGHQLGRKPSPSTKESP